MVQRKGAKPKMSARLAIYERDGYQCQYCFRTVVRTLVTCPEQATLDHVIPFSKGGCNTQDNLITACFECNNLKHDNVWSADHIDQAIDLLKKKFGGK